MSDTSSVLNGAIMPAARKTVTAAVLTAPRKFDMQPVTLREPSDEELLIHVEGCGVCASSIPVYEGREWFSYPMAPGSPGHEGWGTVAKVGASVQNFKPGDRVAFLSDDAFAQAGIAKASEAVKLPPSLDGKPFPGEALGCAMNIFQRSEIRKGDVVAIVGAGFLGLLLIQLAKSEGATVVAVSNRDFSLESAMANGADHMIKMDDHYAIINRVKDVTGGSFCDKVIEATGKEWPLNLAIELTKERGRLIVAGFHQDGMRQVNMQLLNWRGIDMINAHERDPRKYVSGMQAAVEAVDSGKMQPWALFTHQFDLTQTGTAFEHLVNRPEGFIKALIINKNS